MPSFRHVVAKLRALFRRDVVAGEIREELQFHLDMRSGDLEREGLSPVDARRQASARLGNLAILQDRGYDVRGGGVMETILQDIRFGARLLWSQRTFSLVSVLTLAVGMGLTTALFSVIHAAILRPLPFPNPEQLHEVYVRNEAMRSMVSPSLADARAWRGEGRPLVQASVDRGARDVIVLVDDASDPERLRVQQVSEGFFETFGVPLVDGRSFRTEETRPETPLVAILGHAYWQSRFAGDRSVIGKGIRIAGEPATIVGILPRGFYPKVALWQPLRWRASEERFRGSGASVIVRTRSGVTLEAATAELSRLISQPDPALGRASVVMSPLYDRVTSGSGATMWMLGGAVTAILLIACVNVAGLILARGATRQRELAVRAAIGAGRGRLIRQLLTESALLAIVGGAAGVLLARLTLDALVSLVPLSMPVSATPSLNLEVLAFSAAITMLTPVLFGVLPSLRLSRVNVSSGLAGTDKRSGAALSRRGGQWLIGVEVALALVLVIGSSLMIQSFSRLLAVDLGFDPAAFQTLEVAPVDPAPSVAAEYYPALVETIRRLPGVKAVGAADLQPLGGSRSAGFVTIEGRKDRFRVDQRQVLPGFFEAMGVPLKQGRYPTEADRASGQPLVVINEAAARGIFPGGSPIGRQLPVSDKLPVIIGVVGDTRFDGARIDPRPNVYWVLTPKTELSGIRMIVFVRPDTRSTDLTARLRDVARAVGPRVLIDRVRSGEDYLADNVIVSNHRMQLIGLLGAVGLLLTLVGVFSMTAYAVARRTREIGVRVAFGATSSDVVRTILRDTLKPAIIGLVAGLGGGLLATRVIQTMLFQTTPYDPVAFGAAAVVLCVATAVAAWIPARRAAAVDPVKALSTD